jgi:hypothetical protein
LTQFQIPICFHFHFAAVANIKIVHRWYHVWFRS